MYGAILSWMALLNEQNVGCSSCEIICCLGRRNFSWLVEEVDQLGQLDEAR